MTDEPFTPRKPLGRVGKPFELYPVLHAQLRPYIRKDFFFLNIGANDGVSNDPIYPYLLINPKWRGVAVEPVGYNFRQLQYNYREFPNVTLVNAAISEEKKAFYYMDENSGCDPDWVSQFPSFDKGYILNTLGMIRDAGVEGVLSDDAEERILEDHSIVCMSLGELVEKYSIERIDFLNIDTENTNFDVFRMFDFERFAPTVICVETVGFTPAQRTYFDNVISDNNYKFISAFSIYSEIYLKA